MEAKVSLLAKKLVSMKKERMGLVQEKNQLDHQLHDVMESLGRVRDSLAVLEEQRIKDKESYDELEGAYNDLSHKNQGQELGNLELKKSLDVVSKEKEALEDIRLELERQIDTHKEIMGVMERKEEFFSRAISQYQEKIVLLAQFLKSLQDEKFMMQEEVALLGGVIDKNKQEKNLFTRAL